MAYCKAKCSTCGEWLCDDCGKCHNKACVEQTAKTTATSKAV